MIKVIISTLFKEVIQINKTQQDADHKTTKQLKHVSIVTFSL